jgi:phage internal scaffolding protein
MTIRSAYSKKKRFQLNTGNDSMTQQSFKNECDINFILSKYQKTGLVDHVNTYQGNYSDVSNVPSYQEALHIVESAHTAFESLPSSIRKRFSNNPQDFLDFVHNPDNLEEMKEMGLIPNKVQDSIQPPVESEPVPPQAEPEA